MTFFTTIAELRPFLLDYMRERTEADFIQLSKENEFPPPFRFSPESSVIFFRKAAIWNWAVKTLGAHFPESIFALKAAGFCPAPKTAK